MINAFASLKCSKNASIMYKSLSVTAMVLSSDSSDRFRFGLSPCSKELLTLNFKGIFTLKGVITPKITVKLKTATLKANSLTIPSLSQTKHVYFFIILFIFPTYCKLFSQFLNHSNKKKSSFFSFLSIGR